MKKLLEQVVTLGTGLPVKSESFGIAGKTGTALVSQGKSGYKTGTVKYLVSFVGYFPADQPRYSCIVCIQKYGMPASGGKISGTAFKDIAEGVMARNLNVESSYAEDNTTQRNPMQLLGNLNATYQVLTRLGYNSSYSDNSNGKTLWGKVDFTDGQYVYKPKETDRDVMPDVNGLGARDAVFMLEQMGVRVRLHGRGKVKTQSIAAGSKITAGQVCELYLI